MHQEPFQLFGIQHLVTLVFCFALIFFIPVYFKKKSSETKKIIGVSLSVLLLAHTFEHKAIPWTVYNYASKQQIAAW